MVFTKYFEQIANNFIIGVGSTSADVNGENEITEERYNNIIQALKGRPQDTNTVQYMLTVDIEYVPIEREPEPIPEEEPTDFDKGFESGYEQALLDLMELELESEGE